MADCDRFDRNCRGTKASHSQAADDRCTSGRELKQLLLLMDTDQNGKISRQEWMKFMETEFDKLDKDKTGQLDRKEPLQSTVSLKHVRHSELGK